MTIEELKADLERLKAIPLNDVECELPAPVENIETRQAMQAGVAVITAVKD